MWGAIHSYRALEPKDTTNNMNYLVMGPWFHSQINREGRSLGPFTWDGDTTADFRNEVCCHSSTSTSKTARPRPTHRPSSSTTPAKTTGTASKSWPLSCEAGCPSKSKPLYLTANGALSFNATGSRVADKFDEYISDPAKPVPYRPRPRHARRSWRTWLVTDQRFVDGRPDVLTYITEPLTEPIASAAHPWSTSTPPPAAPTATGSSRSSTSTPTASLRRP